MYCKYCGAVIDDAEFCFKCGKPQHAVRNPNSAQQSHVQKDMRRVNPGSGRTTNPRQPVYNQPVSHDDSGISHDFQPRTPQGNGRRYQKKKKKHVLPIVITILLLLAVIIGAVLFLGPVHDEETDNAIAVIQNGYLGEYTDITVKELLDYNYGPRYEQNIWDGGYNGKDELIVEAKYYNSDKDATRIQFTMLNEECFKVTAYVDPDYDFDKATDVLLALNYSYFMAYHEVNREALREEKNMIGFIHRLDEIPSSEALYGAAASYKGNRRELNLLDGSDKLDVSAAMLFDNYGLLDMEIYYNPSLNADEKAPATTEAAEIVETTAPVEILETAAATVVETVPSITEANVPETYPPESHEEENQLPSGPYESDLNPAYQELTLVLMGLQEFQLDYPKKIQSLYSITELGGMFCDPPMEPIVFMPVDLDQDGTDEVIVELSVAGEELKYLILRYYNGTVYGYNYNLHGTMIGTDGYIVREGNNGSYLFQNIWFEQDQIRNDARVVTDPEGFYLDWELAQWHNFDELY